MDNGKYRMDFVGEIENIDYEGTKTLSCEPHAIVLDDGTILVHIRVQTFYVGKDSKTIFTIFQSESKDNGKTWTKPEYFKDRGALPQLIQLENGVTLAIVTRPGIYVYASRDCGKTWDDCIEIMTDQDRSHLANNPPQRPNFWQWAGSCCNCTAYPLGKNKILLAYSDFYIPDENGVKRKGIKTIEVAVD